MTKFPKVFRVLHLLDEQESLDFNKYLRNHVSSQKGHDDSYPLLLILLKIAKTDTYSKEKIARELYGKSTAYNSDKIDRVQNKLLYHLENFIAWQQFRINSHRYERALCDFYLQHNDLDLAQKHLENAQIALENAQERDLAAYYFRILDENLRLQLQKLRNDGLADFQGLDNILDITLIIAKYRQICRLIAAEQNTNKDLNRSFITFVQRYLDRTPHLTNIPVLQLYRAAYFMLSEVEQVRYQAFMHLLATHSTLFSKSEQEELLDYAESYFILRSDTKTLDYNDFFAFYESMDRQEILLSVTHKMDIRRYYRAVTVALNTKHLDWAAYFIEKYKDNLREDFREDAYHNNSAKVLFEQGRFHDMKDRLKIDNKQNPYITMAVYRLHLKTYWVLEDVDLLARYLGKYKQYLKKLKQEQNTTLRSNNLERNENFLKALNKLNKIKGLSKLTLREAKTEFEKKYMKGLLTEKKWLMAIFNAL